MKKFRKVNRGLLLLIVIVVIVAIYLVVSGVKQKSDKEEVVAICQEYIKLQSEFVMLPENFKENPSEMTESDKTKFMDEVESTLTPYYIDNEKTYKNLFESIETNMLELSSGKYYVLEYEKNLEKFDDITFDDNKVSLNATSSVTYVTNDGKSTNEVIDYFSLQKIDGEWKMTYSSWSSVQQMQEESDMNVMYYK